MSRLVGLFYGGPLHGKQLALYTDSKVVVHEVLVSPLRPTPDAPRQFVHTEQVFYDRGGKAHASMGGETDYLFYYFREGES